VVGNAGSLSPTTFSPGLRDLPVLKIDVFYFFEQLPDQFQFSTNPCF